MAADSCRFNWGRLTDPPMTSGSTGRPSGKRRPCPPTGTGQGPAFELPDASNAAPATDPKQADLSQMPFITGGKLFFTLDGVDYVGSGNIFMRNNLLAQ